MLTFLCIPVQRNALPCRGPWGYGVGYTASTLKAVPPPMPLTDTALRQSRPQPKPYRLFDERGMYVEVRPGGGKLFRFKYRYESKEKLLSLGSYPDVSLKLARERRDEARTLLATGIDPSAHRRAEKAAKSRSTANTFEAVALEWLVEQERIWVPRHAVRVRRLFVRDLFPHLGSQPIVSLTAAHLLPVIRSIDERGANDTAHRARQTLGMLFRHAVATGRASHDPSAALKGALPRVKGSHFAALTDPAKLGPLLRTLDGYTGSLTVRCALRLAPLVLVRPGELRHGAWSEVDLEQATWTIPAARMKMRADHIVPLSRQAVAILRELQPLTGQGHLVFPSARGGQRPMSDMACLAAMRTLGIGKDVATGHGWRATARTLLDEVLEYPAHLIEHQLAHTVRDPLGRAYNRTTHLPERRKMMQQWANYLDTLKSDVSCW